MPKVILPDETQPITMPAHRLKSVVDEGKRVVLPDLDCAIFKKDVPQDGAAGGSLPFYFVEPLDADYVEEGGVMDATTDNSEYAEQFATFDEAMASAQGDD